MIDKILPVLSQLISPLFLAGYALITLLAIFSLVLFWLLKTNRQSQNSRFHLSFTRRQWILLGFLAAIHWASLLGFFVPAPSLVSPSIPFSSPVSLTPQSPLTLRFDRPLSRLVKASISPALKGTWQYSSHQFGPLFADSLTFVPEESPQLDIEYTVVLHQILPVTWLSLKSAKELLFVMPTASIPSVISSSPADQAANVSQEQTFTFQLSHPTPPQVEWTVRLEPSGLLYPLKQVDQTHLSFQPATLLNSNTAYTAQLLASVTKLNFATGEIISRQPPQAVAAVSFTTAASPVIDSISPQNTALPHDPVVITFSQAMDAASVEQGITLSPSLKGSYLWKDSKQVTFTPDTNFPLDTEYTLTLSPQIKTQAGGFLERDYTHRFKTIGEIKLLSSDPSANALNVDRGKLITLTFDQPLKPQDFSSLISLQPEVPLLVVHQANTLIITPQTPLTFGQDYLLTLATGLKAEYGKDLASPISLPFRTVPESFALAVPLFKQNHKFTCFAEAARMALTYKGIQNLTELGMMEKIGYDTTARNYVTNTWGDPETGIVGTYDGSGPGGYGAHWQPVAQAMGAYRPVEIKQNWDIPGMLQSIKAGNPVLVWWVNGVWPAKVLNWNTAQGKQVRAVNGMHVEVVTGWEGPLDNPVRIFTNDPWRGKRSYSPETFKNLWQWFGNTAVIVR